MILDVNVLLYATNETSAHHASCRDWLERALNGDTRIGFPWSTVLSFLRMATHPRVMTNPMSIEQAWGYADDWLASPLAWIPAPPPQHLQILRGLTSTHALSGNLLPDADLAALAIGHGVPVVSCDTDFARFTELTWINPVATRA